MFNASFKMTFYKENNTKLIIIIIISRRRRENKTILFCFHFLASFLNIIISNAILKAFLNR